MSETYYAHPTAVIDEGAKIGDGARIWHFSHIMGTARIGAHCTLGQNVFVAQGVVVGQQCKIQNNVSLYEGVTLEDYVFCGPSMVFTNVKTPRCGFPRNTAEHFLETRVRQGASLGANCTVVCGVTIGRWAFVAAGAVVTKDIPDYALVAGVPARQLGWVCECGESLEFLRDQAKCHACQRAYQMLSSGNVERSSQ